MASIDPKDARRAVNGWARANGYADIDTYIAAGGSIPDAIKDIERRMQRLHLARTALYEYAPPPPPPTREDHSMPEEGEYLAIGPDALARAEDEVIGDPVDPDNVAIQGFDV